MFLLVVCLLSIALSVVAFVVLRYSLLLRLGHSNCPKCGFEVVRKKRKPLDRWLGKILMLPVGRYHCIYYRCNWEGALIDPLQGSLLQERLHAPPIQEPNPPLTESFNQGMLLDSSQEFASERNLAQSLKNNEIELYYQPNFNFETKNITGVEVLLRWKHPERGLIYPADFLPLAEDNGFIFALGQWILRQACHQLLQWHEAGFYPLRVSINLSMRQFYQPNLVETIHQVLDQTGLEPQSLELEITEDTVMQNLALATSILRRLQDSGVRITMDSFGIGNIPRRYLRRIALNALKIDRSLIRTLKPQAKQVEVLRSFVSLAESLNLEMVAKGVETQEQLSVLRALGCKVAQGYLFDYPISAEDTTSELQSNWFGRRMADAPVR